MSVFDHFVGLVLKELTHGFIYVFARKFEKYRNVKTWTNSFVRTTNALWYWNSYFINMVVIVLSAYFSINSLSQDNHNVVPYNYVKYFADLMLRCQNSNYKPKREERPWHSLTFGYGLVSFTIPSLYEKCLYSELVWSVFSRIRTVYIFGTLFTQCIALNMKKFLNIFFSAKHK